MRREDVFADEDRLAGHVVGDASTDEHRRPSRDVESVGVGLPHDGSTNGLAGSAEVHCEHFMERLRFHLGSRQVFADGLGNPDGDPCERLAVSEVQTLYFEYVFGCEDGGDPGSVRPGTRTRISVAPMNGPTLRVELRWCPTARATVGVGRWRRTSRRLGAKQ